MSNLILCSAILSAILTYPVQIFALGLSTQFADVILENLELGEVYNLRVIKNLPYVVKNNSDSAQKVQVVVESPRQDKLMSGYEAIPEIEWLKVIPNEFTLGPKENGYADIVISIPKDEKYQGKHYQVTIVARTIPDYSGGGLAFGVELESRLRLSIGGPGPATIQALKKKQKLLSLNFDLKPESLYIKNVIIGKKIKLDNSLTVSNRDRSPVILKFKSIPFESRFGIAPEYEPAPKPEFLQFKSERIKIGSRRIKDIEMFVNIPDDEQYRNKKYVFIVKAEVEKQDVPIEVYSRVYITTK